MKWNRFCVRAKGTKQNKTISFENSLPLLFLFFCLCVSSTIEKNVVNILIATGWYNNYTYIIPYYILLFNVSCLLLLVICVCTCVCFCPTVLIIISSVSIHFFHIFFVFSSSSGRTLSDRIHDRDKNKLTKKTKLKKKKKFLPNVTVTNESAYYYYHYYYYYNCIHSILFMVDAMMTVGRVIVQFLRSSTMALPSSVLCNIYSYYITECVLCVYYVSVWVRLMRNDWWWDVKHETISSFHFSRPLSLSDILLSTYWFCT